MIDLSVLVCSVSKRYDNFLLKIEKQLFNQYESLAAEDQERVELLVLTDNKKMMLGHKRNVMVNMAQGKYIVFVDDDDRIADDYIQALLDGTASNADSIVFQAEVSLNGEPARICYYSKDNKVDFNNSEGYHRIPNHISCIKREVSLKSSFPNVLYGEDSGYSKVLLPHIKTEHKINKVLYYYDYSSETTETQAWRYNKIDSRDTNPIVDVVILSKADDQNSMQMTQSAIDSCFYMSNGLSLNITVVENGRGRVKYDKATTLHKPEAFNYNGFANTAASLGTAEWILIANNDLSFRDGWLHALLAAGNDVVSPHEENDSRQKGIIENESGFVNGRHFSGWCFMIKRELWEKIGKFDTDVSFWCSDDVVIEQVKAVGITPMLVKDSLVDHRPSTTLRTMPMAIQEDMKWCNVYIFNTKYKKDLFKERPEYINWVKNNR